MSINVHRLLPLVQATVRSTGPGSGCERLLLAQRVNIGCLAVAIAFNAATPFITPVPPWLSDVPVVIGLPDRIQSATSMSSTRSSAISLTRSPSHGFTRPPSRKRGFRREETCVECGLLSTHHVRL